MASISAEFEGKVGLVSVSDSDSAIGFWIGTGVDLMLTDTFSVGLLARLSRANVELFDTSGKAGGTHIGIFAAYHFGK